MVDNCSRILNNIKYVPDLKRNLISMGALDGCGCTIKIGKEVIKVIRGAMTIMKGSMRNGLHVLVGLTTTYNATKIGDNLIRSTELWNLRLRYVSNRGL